MGKSLNQLLETFKLQFAQDETSIGTIHLDKMQIDMGDSEPVLQRPYPIMMKHYNWVRNEINKFLDAQVIHSSHGSWSAPIIVVPDGDGGKCLVIDYRALNKITWKFMWPMPRVEDIFSKLNGKKVLLNTRSLCCISSNTPQWRLHSQCSFYVPFWKYEYLKFPFGLAQAPAYFQELMNKALKDLPITIACLDNIII